jgi:hypothetical protein
MPEPIFGKEFYDKWFVPKPMTVGQKAEFERMRTYKKAYERDVLITHNAAWIVYNEFYPNSFTRIKPSSLTARQILMAQRLLVEFIDGRRAYKTISAFAQSVLYKTPQSLAGLGLIAFNFVRKLPEDAFSCGKPSEITIASIQGDSDLKAYVAGRLREEVRLEFDGIELKTTSGTTFF